MSKRVIIFDTGKVYWCYEHDLYVPPDGEPRKDEEIRENYTSYNEKETIKTKGDLG